MKVSAADLQKLRVSISRVCALGLALCLWPISLQANPKNPDCEGQLLHSKPSVTIEFVIHDPTAPQSQLERY